MLYQSEDQKSGPSLQILSVCLTDNRNLLSVINHTFKINDKLCKRRHWNYFALLTISFPSNTYPRIGGELSTTKAFDSISVDKPALFDT